MADSIPITVNGEARTIPPGLTLAALLHEIGLDTRRVAVERNLEIIHHAYFAQMAIEPGDALEIIPFIGG